MVGHGISVPRTFNWDLVQCAPLFFHGCRYGTHPDRNGHIEKVLAGATVVAVITELFVLGFAARSKPMNSVSDYKHEKDNRDQVATPPLAKGLFEVISHHDCSSCLDFWQVFANIAYIRR
jgi:hypothetical protein